MATNPKSDIAPQEEIQKTDNLTIIPGVNKALEQWLRESLKVYTFADLAKLSAQKIRARGKQTGEVLSIEELEPILVRAKELADAASAASMENAPPIKAKPEKVSAAPKTAKEWNDFANFVVCFERKNVGGKEEKRTKIEHRTGIQHMETEEQASWPGVETDEACRWMLQRLGDEINVVAEKAVEKETPQAAQPSTAEFSAPASLEIIQLQLFQPLSNDHPQELLTQNRTFNGFIKSGTPSSLALTFKLTGEAAGVTKRKTEYSVAFAAQDLFTSAVTQLGTSTPDFLEEGQLTYTAWLSPFTMPTGVYSLKIVTAIRDAQPLWASTEVPLLQVA